MLSLTQIANNLQICRKCRRSMGAVHSGVGIVACPVDGRPCYQIAGDGSCAKQLHETIAAPQQFDKPSGGWGPPMWRRLHTAANADGAWMRSFTANVPCGDCKRHWLALLKELPPVYGAGWFEWSWRVHNRVNARLGKADISLEEARAIW